MESLELKQIREHLLVMLVRDFGYTEKPTYGHAPLRHQFAWTMATRAMNQTELDSVIKRALDNAKADGEKIPDPYRLELDGD